MKKLLVVVDMQKDFVDGSLGTEEAVAIVPRVKAKIEARKGEVGEDGESIWDIIFTRDTHGPDYLKTQEGIRLPVEHCIEGTEGWEIIPELRESADQVIDKPTFGSTELIEYVRDRSVRQMELIGLCTDICVVSNALLLKANFPEIEIGVDASCCAGVTVESHKAALQVMEMCQIDVW